MEKKNQVDQFFEFEVRNNLFQIKDKNGVVVWDVLRYYVLHYIEHGTDIDNSFKRKSVSSYSYKIKKVLEAFLYFLTHWNRKYLFLISSRAVKDGIVYDRDSDRVLQAVDNPRDCFLVEMGLVPSDLSYKYQGQSMFNLLFLAGFCRVPSFDFNPLMGLIKKEFPNASLTKDTLVTIYKEFYKQYYYYKLFFLIKRPQQIFYKQANIQKGLILAAKERRITICEIQHGLICRYHLAYSYPKGIAANQIYSPDRILTYGSFWGRDCYFPGTLFTSIGIDKESQDRNEYKGNKDVLIVSSDVYGKELIEFTQNVSLLMPECKFYYKLHPNEFSMIESYKEKFKDYKNITLYSNEKEVTDLFREVAFVFLIQSTVAFQAMSAGIKVISWRHKEYWIIDCLWNEPGFFLANDEEDFVQIYKSHLNDEINPSMDFFEPYNKDKTKVIL